MEQQGAGPPRGKFVAPEAAAATPAGETSQAKEQPPAKECRFSYLEYARDGLVLLDGAGRALEVAPSYPHVLGYEPTQRLAIDTVDLIHPDDRQRWQRAWSASLECTQEAATVVLRERHADGSWQWMDVTLINRLADPRIGGVVATLRRLTVAKTSERERRNDPPATLACLRAPSPLTPLPLIGGYTGVSWDASRVLAEPRATAALLGNLLAQRTGSQYVVVLMVQVDQLSLVTRAHGHDTAADLLVAAVARVQEVLHAGDSLGLYDADRFVIMFPSPGGLHAGIAVARQVAAALSAPFFLGGDPLSGDSMSGDPIALSASIGITATCDSQMSPSVLLAEADLALGAAVTRAKPWSVFTSSTRASAVHEVLLPAMLAQALEREQFVVHYQPVIDLDSERPVGAEALVRWAQPNGTLLGPDCFIAAAERSGVIVALGEWVLRAACVAAAGWPTPSRVSSGASLHGAGGSALGGLSVAVNVSARQLQDPQLPAIVQAALADSGLAPGRLTLEITESMLMTDPELATRRLQVLRRLGVGVAIDDFGTGYSSLASLKRLPVDVIKIDRSFVTGLGRDRGDEAIVTSILTLAEAFDLDVIAEGVETKEHATKLRHLGCHLAQGFLYSRPIAREEMDAFVRAPGRGGDGRP